MFLARAKIETAAEKTLNLILRLHLAHIARWLGLARLVSVTTAV